MNSFEHFLPRFQHVWSRTRTCGRQSLVEHGVLVLRILWSSTPLNRLGYTLKCSVYPRRLSWLALHGDKKAGDRALAWCLG